MKAATQFFDTNILVYTLVSTDRRHQKAETLLLEGGAISVQILNEFANVAIKKLKLSCDETHRALHRIRQLCPTCAPLTVTTHETAIAIAARYGFSFYDALVLAAALETGCDTLLTEDMNHGQRIANRLTIHNPFA